MHFFGKLWNAYAEYGSHFLLVAMVLGHFAIRYRRRDEEARSRLVIAAGLAFSHFVAIPIGVALELARVPFGDDLVVIGGLLGALSAVAVGGVILFEGIVRRFRPGFPRIVPDVIMLGAGIVVLIRTSSRLGVDVSGIIATSAVLTAVIGLALQDTLGNVLGGLALQLDGSLSVGDWVKIGEVNGRVSEIRWRYTAVETRNWETILVPNSVVTKSQVIIVGQRIEQPEQWRRWVYFHVDYRHTPTEVIDTVEAALRAQPIERVAANPPPNCILMDFGDSACKYAVRYWLTDLAVDDPTDSVVRTRIYFALSRARIPLAVPAKTIFLKTEDKDAIEQKRELDFARRMDALDKIDLFRDLSDDEQAELAQHLHRAPFARGETLTKQGSIAHYLYTVVSGEVSIRIKEGAGEREVSKLGAGQFFGEMALLTGERRRATVVALTDVECYRLDASAFKRLLERHAELAGNVAKVLAEREMSLNADRERMDAASRASMLARNESQFLGKIRSFFGFAEDEGA